MRAAAMVAVLGLSMIWGVACSSPTGRKVCLDLVGSDELNTFDGEPQLLSYVRWATLHENADGTFKFEQGSPLVGYANYERSATPLTGDDETEVPHNPTPSML